MVFELLRTFTKAFVMFVNEDVCETVLVISDSTDDDFSESIYLIYQSFDVKCLLLSWDACVYRVATEW